MTEQGDHNDIYQQLGHLTGRLSAVEGGVTRIENKLDTSIELQQAGALDIANFKGKAIGVVSVVGLFSGGLASWVWNKITGS